MKVRARSVFFVLAASLTGAVAINRVLAHPPDNPYDNTIFAPFEQDSGIPISLGLIADGLTSPLGGKVAPGEPGRLYVVDQMGKLWAITLATGAKTVMLDLSSRLVTLGVLGEGTFDERGFLGVAFHPQYQTNGKLYTYTSEPNGGPPTFPTTLPPGSTADHQNVLAEWTANQPGNPGAGVNLASRRELMRIDWPQFNHDAGDIVFGPDGLLYVPTGDGGGADDLDGDLSFGEPGFVGHSGSGNAQRLTVPLGKILRIDVGGNNSGNGQYGIPASNPFVNEPGAVKEIYAYGLRNPYRLSFDSATGALLAGDVGQNDIEEVNVIVAGGNYGWNLKEGTLCFDNKGTAPGEATTQCPPGLPAGLIDPIAQYDTHHEGHSVIGGFVYHGTAIPQLRDRYVFGEWSRVFTFPDGPDNYGRILYLQEKGFGAGPLRTIKEVKGFADAADALGLTDLTRPPRFVRQTLSVQGFAQDTAGEIYLLGNRTGRPFGTGGVVLKLMPKN